MSEKTVFQKIIDREIPADIWYENNQSIAILDIEPVALGHTLHIPKHPYRWIQDIPPVELGNFFQSIPRLINTLKSATGCDFVQVVTTGVHVPHVHVHLIPRMLTDDVNDLSPTTKNSFGGEELVGRLIKQVDLQI